MRLTFTFNASFLAYEGSEGGQLTKPCQFGANNTVVDVLSDYPHSAILGQPHILRTAPLVFQRPAWGNEVTMLITKIKLIVDDGEES